MRIGGNLVPLYFHFQNCEILNFEIENIIIYTLKFLFQYFEYTDYYGIFKTEMFKDN